MPDESSQFQCYQEKRKPNLQSAITIMLHVQSHIVAGVKVHIKKRTEAL